MSRGFGSNVSTCEGPPDMKRKMTRLALAGYCGGRTPSGFVAGATSASAREIKSSENKLATPSIPKPLAKRFSIWRRFNDDRNCISNAFINLLPSLVTFVRTRDPVFTNTANRERSDSVHHINASKWALWLHL